jgi:hypothetical protein
MSFPWDVELLTVLINVPGLDLATLNEYKQSNGRRAYYANLPKTAYWTCKASYFSTFAEAPLQSSLRLCAEWCLAMLQPDPSKRISISELSRMISRVDQKMSVIEASTLKTGVRKGQELCFLVTVASGNRTPTKDSTFILSNPGRLISF